MILFRVTLIALMGLFFSQQALASPESEAFVRENAELVLATLGDETLTSADRKAKFQEYMNEFSNQRRIAHFAIGKYKLRFSREDLARYRTSFTRYSLASYESEFDSFRGGMIEVNSSTDAANGRSSIVNSVVTAPNGEQLEVLWRLEIQDDTFQVIDVGLNLDGNLLWLAMYQREQFMAVLDRNQGSPDALIAKLDELTADLVAKLG